MLIRRLVVLVGTPGSGKDMLIRAVNDLGAQHAQIVPKHTSRGRLEDDRNEMICPGDPGYDLEGCDIQYENYGDRYGIHPSKIWDILGADNFPVVVVSDIEAINRLRALFGELVLLIYVHSEKRAEEYKQEQAKLGQDAMYVERRTAEYRQAFDIYLENFLAFDHVLINSGLPEDLYDQIFRLFRAYELDLGHAAVKMPVSERILMQLISRRD
jgi:guanylate kinase